jgi:hypothetical protein
MCRAGVAVITEPFCIDYTLGQTRTVLHGSHTYRIGGFIEADTDKLRRGSGQRSFTRGQTILLQDKRNQLRVLLRRKAVGIIYWHGAGRDLVESSGRLPCPLGPEPRTHQRRTGLTPAQSGAVAFNTGTDVQIGAGSCLGICINAIQRGILCQCVTRT